MVFNTTFNNISNNCSQTTKLLNRNKKKQQQQKPVECVYRKRMPPPEVNRGTTLEWEKSEIKLGLPFMVLNIV